MFFRYTTAAFFLKNRFIKLKMNNDTTFLTCSNGAKTVTVDVIAGFHRTLVLMQSNADSYDALTEAMS